MNSTVSVKTAQANQSRPTFLSNEAESMKNGALFELFLMTGKLAADGAYSTQKSAEKANSRPPPKKEKGDDLSDENAKTMGAPLSSLLIATQAAQTGNAQEQSENAMVDVALETIIGSLATEAVVPILEGEPDKDIETSFSTKQAEFMARMPEPPGQTEISLAPDIQGYLIHTDKGSEPCPLENGDDPTQAVQTDGAKSSQSSLRDLLNATDRAQLVKQQDQSTSRVERAGVASIAAQDQTHPSVGDVAADRSQLAETMESIEEEAAMEPAAPAGASRLRASDNANEKQAARRTRLEEKPIDDRRFPGIAPERAASADALRAEPARTRDAAPAVEQQNLFDVMVERMTSAQENGVKMLEIQLKPDFLGKVSIQLALSESGLHARIHAEDQNVRGALNGQIARLIESLSEKGIRVSAVEVAYPGVTDHQGFDRPSPHRQHPDERHDNGRTRTTVPTMDATQPQQMWWESNSETEYDLPHSTVEYRA